MSEIDYGKRLSREQEKQQFLRELLGEQVTKETMGRWQREVELLEEAARGDIRAQALIAKEDALERYNDAINTTAWEIIDGGLSETAAREQLSSQLGREVVKGDGDWRELMTTVAELKELERQTLDNEI